MCEKGGVSYGGELNLLHSSGSPRLPHSVRESRGGPSGISRRMYDRESGLITKEDPIHRRGTEDGSTDVVTDLYEAWEIASLSAHLPDRPVRLESLL